MTKHRSLAWLLVLCLALLAACSTGSGAVTAQSASSSAPGGAATDAALAEAAAAANTSAQDSVPFSKVKPGSAKGMTVGYISAGEESPFVHAITVGVKQQAQKAGMSLKTCDAQFDAAKALKCARDLSTQGIDGLFNMQIDNAAAAGICNVNPRIPTIALAIHQKPCEKSFVGADDERAGELAGVAMGTYMKKRFDCRADKILSLEDQASGTTNERRVAGWTKGYEGICGDDVAFDHVDSAGLIDKSQKVTTDYLTAAPDAKAIVVFTIDDNAALGALAAASTAGRAGSLFVASQGGDESAHCKIRQNEQWVADIGYFPERYGEIAVPAMMDLLAGKTVKDTLQVQLSAFNKTNIDTFYGGEKC